jgi:hypothetical protein
MNFKTLVFFLVLALSGNATLSHEDLTEIGTGCMKMLTTTGRRRTPFPSDDFNSLISDMCIWKRNLAQIAEGPVAIETHLKETLLVTGGSWKIDLSERFIDTKKSVFLQTFTIMGRTIRPHITTVSLWINPKTRQIDLIDEVRGLISPKALGRFQRHSFDRKSFMQRQKTGRIRKIFRKFGYQGSKA